MNIRRPLARCQEDFLTETSHIDTATNGLGLGVDFLEKRTFLKDIGEEALE